jgi:uncharacterized membrane protein YfcA
MGAAPVDTVFAVIGVKLIVPADADPLNISTPSIVIFSSCKVVTGSVEPNRKNVITPGPAWLTRVVQVLAGQLTGLLLTTPIANPVLKKSPNVLPNLRVYPPPPPPPEDKPPIADSFI